MKAQNVVIEDTVKLLKLIPLLFFTVTLTHCVDFFEDLAGSSDPLVSEANTGNIIPAKIEGKRIYFEIIGSDKESIAPESSKVRFDPYYDAADFRNFASASVVDGRLIRKRDVNGGTCFGISYFTSMWYSRLIRPIQQNKKPSIFKTHSFNISLWDALWSDLDKAGKTEMDGVNFVTLKIQSDKVKAGDTSFFSQTKMSSKLQNYRLYAMSQGEYKNPVQLGAIAHHRDQTLIKKLDVNTTDGRDSATKVEMIKQRLDEHGTVVFYYHKYKVSDAWYQWDKWEWGHACLIYEIKRVQVASDKGATREAIKIRYVDPNATYHHKVKTPEGYGHYLLYFPDSKQLTFSKKVQGWYDIQTRSSVIDNDEVRFGFYDVYEGHPVQEQLAKQSFLASNVGVGKVLNPKEEELLDKNGKIKLAE